MGEQSMSTINEEIKAQIAGKTEQKFVIESAQKYNYNIADDYIVDLCKFLGTQEQVKQEEILYVTSDRGLMERLLKQGAVNIMKSGQFLRLLEDTLKNEFTKLFV